MGEELPIFVHEGRIYLKPIFLVQLTQELCKKKKNEKHLDKLADELLETYTMIVEEEESAKERAEEQKHQPLEPCFGFQIHSDEEEYYDDEEDLKKSKKKTKKSIIRKK